MRLFGRKGDGQADPQLTGLRFDQVFLMHSYQLTTLGKNICSRTGQGTISFLAAPSRLSRFYLMRLRLFSCSSLANN